MGVVCVLKQFWKSWSLCDRHLTSEGCNAFSMAKTSGKAQCAPHYKNTITYSTSV